MAEQLWERNEFDNGRVGLWAYYDDATASSDLTRLSYKNLSDSQALFEIFLANGTRLQYFLPANTEREETPQANQRPALAGLTTSFTWPANPRVSASPGKG